MHQAYAQRRPSCNIAQEGRVCSTLWSRRSAPPHMDSIGIDSLGSDLLSRGDAAGLTTLEGHERESLPLLVTRRITTSSSIHSPWPLVITYTMKLMQQPRQALRKLTFLFLKAPAKRCVDGKHAPTWRPMVLGTLLGNSTYQPDTTYLKEVSQSDQG